MSHVASKRRHVWLGCAGGALFLLSCVGAVALASTPKLDQTFGKHGRLLAELPRGSYPTVGGAIDGSGRILSTASVNGDLLVQRFLPTGAPDPSFGDSGRLATDFGHPVNPVALRVDSGGRVIVAGIIRAPGLIYQTFLARYLPDGTLDTSFSGDGLVQFDRPQIIPLSTQPIAIDSSDRVVVVGDSANSPSGNFIARYQNDGTLDTAFHANLGDLSCCGSAALLAVSIDAQGRILGTGAPSLDDPDVTDQPVVWRFLPDGRPDPSFAKRGQDVLSLGQAGAEGVGTAVDSKGRILVADSDYAVKRLRANGSADSSFGHGAWAHVGRAFFGDDSLGVSVDSRDLPILAGSLDQVNVHKPDTTWFGFTRLRSNGGIDPAFGPRVRKLGFGQPKCKRTCPALKRRKTFGGPPMLDSEGRLVLVGWTQRRSRYYTAIARLRLP